MSRCQTQGGGLISSEKQQHRETTLSDSRQSRQRVTYYSSLRHSLPGKLTHEITFDTNSVNLTQGVTCSRWGPIYRRVLFRFTSILDFTSPQDSEQAVKYWSLERRSIHMMPDLLGWPFILWQFCFSAHSGTFASRHRFSWEVLRSTVSFRLAAPSKRQDDTAHCW